MTLTYSEILTLHSAIMNIGVKGKANLTLAENAIVLKAHVDTINSTQERLVKQYGDGSTEMNSKHPKWGEFFADYQETLKTEIDLGENPFTKIKKDDLDFDRVSQQQIVVLTNNDLFED